ncbi:hypothetical protein CH341_29535, partial [Rhodoplanes roseus]
MQKLQRLLLAGTVLSGLAGVQALAAPLMIAQAPATEEQRPGQRPAPGQPPRPGQPPGQPPAQRPA